MSRGISEINRNTEPKTNDNIRPPIKASLDSISKIEQ